jgi:hypothetical protein
MPANEESKTAGKDERRNKHDPWMIVIRIEKPEFGNSIKVSARMGFSTSSRL